MSGPVNFSRSGLSGLRGINTDPFSLSLLFYGLTPYIYRVVEVKIFTEFYRKKLTIALPQNR